MMRLAILALPAALAACAVSPDTKGAVVAMNGDTVTIRGAYDMTLSSGVAKPTPAMITQAEEQCPGAKYLSASPYDEWTFAYLFRCPK